MRVLVVADTDSYLKWGATLASSVPGPVGLVLLRSPLLPAADQTRAALAGTRWEGAAPPVVTLLQLRRLVRRRRPDVLVLALVGPLVDLVARTCTRSRRRPVVVSGLPGIAVPVSPLALHHRRRADVFVAHSRREADDVADLLTRHGSRTRVVLARLPFLTAPDGTSAPTGDRSGAPARRVVYTPQALAPRAEVDRRAVLEALSDLAGARPDLDVVVKLRGEHGQEQTHRESTDYRRAAVGPGGTSPAWRVATGPLREHLRGAVGLVTVGSTASLEAIAVGVPVLVLTDFGLGPETFNEVFRGSGVTGTLADLRVGRFRHPEAEWLEQNYFHAEQPEVWSGLADVPRATGRAVRLVRTPPGSVVLAVLQTLLLPAAYAALRRAVDVLAHGRTRGRRRRRPG